MHFRAEAVLCTLLCAVCDQLISCNERSCSLTRLSGKGLKLPDRMHPVFLIVHAIAFSEVVHEEGHRVHEHTIYLTSMLNVVR